MEAQAILMIVVTTLITGVMLVFIFVMIAKWNKGRRSESVSEEELLALPRHRCPKCGVGMKPGLSLASRGILWRAAGGTNRNVFYGKFDAVVNTMNWSMLPHYNRSWMCEQCQYLLVDASAMVKVKKQREV